MTTASPPRRLALYRYQEDAFKAVFEAEGRGVTRQVVSLPTGAGKTILAAHLIGERRPAVFLCHRDELVSQTIDKLHTFDPALTVGICKAERGRNAWELQGFDVVIASAQTLAREARLTELKKAIPDLPLLIVDECFPAGTLVDGRPIETIAVGDTVRAFDHRAGRVVAGRVARLFKRPVRSLVRVSFRSGRTVVCTPEHPFFDGDIYRPALTLTAGTMVFTTIQEPLHARSIVRHLSAMRNTEAFGARSTVYSMPGRGPAGGHQEAAFGSCVHGVRNAGDVGIESCNCLSHEGAGVLLRPVHAGVGVAAVLGEDGRNQSPIRIYPDEGQQPNAPARSEGRGRDKDAPSRVAGVGRTGRERTAYSAAATIGSRTRLADGVRGGNRFRASSWPSEVLQVGHRGTFAPDCHRGGWELAQGDLPQGGGCPEDGLPGIDWVDRVEVLEPGSDGRFGGLCPDGHVYNFEVSGLNNYFANGVLVHNCHHSAAATWTRTIETLNPRLLVGLTATPKRGDGVGLDGLFQEIVYSLPMRDLVEVGKLARPIGLRVGTSVDLGAVHTRGGEFVESELSTIINTPQRNSLVVDAWEKHIRDGGRKRTIAFCVDVAHAHDLCATFRARGHVADVVTGATPTDERARMYRDLKSGALPVLISVMVLTEGFDEPLVDSALMCRPTQSQALYIQMAGRALRQAEGRPDALIVDFVDVTARHNLQTILTLAGDAPVEEPEEGPLDLFAGVDAAEVKLAQAESRKARIRSGAELLGDLLGVAPVVWQRDGDRWFASTGAKEWISVIPFDGGFAPIRVGDDGFEFLFDRSVDAQTAMNIAQSAVPKNTLTKRDADWRNGLASEKQLRILRLPPDTYMSRGEASERIDRKFFARAFKESGAVEIEESA